jgi:hypothetical protein
MNQLTDMHLVTTKMKHTMAVKRIYRRKNIVVVVQTLVRSRREMLAVQRIVAVVWVSSQMMITASLAVTVMSVVLDTRVIIINITAMITCCLSIVINIPIMGALMRRKLRTSILNVGHKNRGKAQGSSKDDTLCLDMGLQRKQSSRVFSAFIQTKRFI